jgi:ABC-type Na+ efflux pump permease subunit
LGDRSWLRGRLSVLRNPRVIVARRELSVLRREKTIVLALLIQLFIAAFSSFLVVGLVSLYAPGEVDGYTVEVAVTGDATEDLLAATEDTDGIRARTYSTQSAARDAFDRGEVAAVLAAERRDGQVHVDAVAPTSNVQTTVIVVQLRETLRAYERSERAERAANLETDILALAPEPRSSPYYGFTYTVLVPLLLFLPVFVSGSIVVDSLTEEFDRGTFELLRVAPISVQQILEGKLLAGVALAPVQAGLWLGLLRLNGTPIHAPGLLLVLVTALTLLVVVLGAAVSLPVGSRRAAQSLYSLGTLTLFAIATLSPGNPVNTVALLAIGSAGTAQTVAVGGYLVIGILALLVLKRFVRRQTAEIW